MQSRSLLQRAAAAPHIVWSVLFILAPLAFVFFYAFTDAEGAFTFANMAQLWEPNYRTVFFRSIAFAMLATLICLVIAYPIAYAISQAKPKTQRLLIMLVMLPMWMNFLIRTYSWMAILEHNGIINRFLGLFGVGPIPLINTPFAVILGMVYNFLPYMILPIYTVVSKLDPRVIEAAADLGCTPLQSLGKVVLPMSMSGVLSGITMVFVPSVSTFYISQKLGGGKYDMVGDTIERQFQSAYNYNLGAAMSLVLMVLILVSMLVLGKASSAESEAPIV